jgi:ribosome-associated protein YbcJ (S4-like RNA binding protein)
MHDILTLAGLVRVGGNAKITFMHDILTLAGLVRVGGNTKITTYTYLLSRWIGESWWLKSQLNARLS